MSKIDAAPIINHVVIHLQQHLREVLLALYVQPIDMDVVSPLENSPVARHIRLLVSVANGRSYREDDVRESLLAVSLLFKYIAEPPEWSIIQQQVTRWLNREGV